MQLEYCNEDYGVIRLSEDRRLRFKEPLGQLYSQSRINEALNIIRRQCEIANKYIITVGDRVTSFCIENKLVPKIAIIDRKEKRGKFKRTFVEYFNRIVIAENEAGTINFNLCKDILSALKNPGNTIIIIIGEEDLVASLAILAANNGDLVIYGQPNQGIVLCRVNDNLKTLILSIIGIEE